LKPSLRAVLGESHVGAVAIAVLLFWSLLLASQFVWQNSLYIVFRVADFLATAIAILGMPFISDRLSVADRWYLQKAAWQLLSSVWYFAAAFFLSRWIFGTGPFIALRGYVVRFNEEPTCLRS